MQSTTFGRSTATSLEVFQKRFHHRELARLATKPLEVFILTKTLFLNKIISPSEKTHGTKFVQ